MTREAIKAAIDARDPINIIFLDATNMNVLNNDEYAPEVDLVCRCVAKCGGSCSAERLVEILRAVFREMFGDELMPRDDTFEQIAENILRDTTDGTDVAQVEVCNAAIEGRLFAQLFGEPIPATNDDSSTDTEKRLVAAIFADDARRRRCLKILEETYRGAVPQLKFQSPFELLIAVILSAQCTDKRVNLVTQELFPVANTPEKILQLGQVRLEEIIRPCGLSRSKAQHIIGTARLLIERHGGAVPRDFDELIKLPGVGRKTANVVMSVAFKLPAIAVDTHVFRLANRLKLATGKTPLEVELGLQKVIPRDLWADSHHWLIWHGRQICTARNPKCDVCPLSKICPSATT